MLTLVCVWQMISISLIFTTSYSVVFTIYAGVLPTAMIFVCDYPMFCLFSSLDTSQWPAEILLEILFRHVLLMDIIRSFLGVIAYKQFCLLLQQVVCPSVCPFVFLHDIDMLQSHS